MRLCETPKLYPLPKIYVKDLIDFHRNLVFEHGTGIMDSNDFIIKMREYFRRSSTEPTGRDVGRLEEMGLVSIKDGGTKIEIKATPEAVRGQNIDNTI